MKVLIFLFYFFILFHHLSGEMKNTNQRKLRFFCLEIHGAVSADVKKIFEKLGHEVVYWAVNKDGVGYSRFTHGKENDPVEFINFDSWTNCDMKMYEQFHEKYKDYLNQFDAFISPFNCSFALLYEKLNKPIIIINAVRYELPFTNKPKLWSLLNKFLINRVDSNKIFMVCNNKADRKYLKHYTGLDSVYIPSLCLYTQAKYTGTKKFFICQPSKHFQLNDFLINKYPQLISKNLERPYQWQELYSYKGIIHFPYQISTMSLFEEYSANVPLFFPSKKFLIKLRDEYPFLINEVTCLIHLSNQPVSPPNIPGEPHNLSDPKIVRFWIDNADFYDKKNMPYIQYFNSFEHLKILLEMVDLNLISQQMKIHNIKRKAMVFKKWKSILEKVKEACDKN